MRAGDLDREIIIQRATSALDQNRSPVTTWAPVATLRAALFTASTSEVIAGFGAEAQDIIVFETRWLDGVTVKDRISYQGADFDIKAVTEIGRRRGLQIRAIARTA